MFTLWRGFYLSLSFLMATVSAIAQPVCGDLWYDTGGPTGIYQNNENYSTTFCPDIVGQVVTITFNYVDLEVNSFGVGSQLGCWDYVQIYNGPTTSSPSLGVFCGEESGDGGSPSVAASQLNIGDLFTSTHSSGCLTVRFFSDASVQETGWEVQISCGPPPNCSPPVVAFSQERDCEDFSFEVVATVSQAATPLTAPLLVATASVNGQNLPGVGGVFPNSVGSTVTLGSLPLDENVLITISVFGFTCPLTQTFFTSSIGCPVPLTCGEGLDVTYCYSNNDDAIFLYESPNAEPISFYIVSGLIEAGWDLITIYDGEDTNAPVLFSGDNGGNLAGVSALATSGFLLVDITADGIFACINNSFGTSPINWIVGCGEIEIPGCTDPTALNYAPVATIDNGSCIFPAENDEPCGAFALVCNGPALTGNFSNASLTYDDACFGAGPGDLWFSFEANGTSTYLVSSVNMDAVVQLFRDNGNGCGFESLEVVTACSDFPESFQGLYEAGTYYFVVRQWSPFSTNAYTVSLNCVDGAPDNDEPCGATELVCNGNSITAAFLGATQTLNDACFNGSPTDLDIWYTFESDGIQSYFFTAISGFPYISLYTADDCSGSLTQVVACQQFPPSFNGNYPEGTYYVRIRSSGNALASLSLQCALPPDNNNACGAFEINAGATCNNTLVSNVGASGSSVPNPGCAFYTGGDVWHTLNVDAPSSISINTSGVSGSPVFDTGLAVYSGDCDGTLTLLACNDDFNGLYSQIQLSAIQPEQTLYIRTWEFGGEVFGTWNLCITTLPVDCENIGANIGAPCNDGNPLTAFDTVTANCECVGEVPAVGDVCENPFVVASLPYTTSGNTNIHANNYTFGNVPPAAPNAVAGENAFYSQFYITGDDVVYSFTPEEDVDIVVELTGHASWVGLYVFTDCPFSSTVGYDNGTDAAGRLIEPLPVLAGQTYYVVISTNAPPQSTAYTLNIFEKVYDCQELGLDFGDLCDDGNPDNFGDVIQDDCSCQGGPFDGCLNGFLFGTASPVCDGPVVEIFGSWTNEYSLVNNVLNGADYTFSLSNSSFFITISNANGTEVLASGQGTLNWTANLNGEVRFYSHIDAICTPTSQNSHTRSVSFTCDNQQFDCPELQINFGDLCDDGDPESLGDVIQEDCTCLGGPFEGCLDGFLWSAQPPVVCGGDPSVVFSFTDYYTTLNVVNGAEYTFALNNPELFITISNSAGTQVLATGQGTLVWNATLNAEVRFYVHLDVFCTQVFDFFHTRTVTVDCTTQIYDCPDLQVNFGDSCNDGIPDNGIDQYNEFCECVGSPFAGCTNGFQFGSATVICGTTQSVFGVWANEYSVINGLEIGAQYAFATLGVGANYYITITNLAGTEVLATGQGLVEYTSDAVQNVRFYAHVDGQCSATSGGATSHTRTITADCTTQIYDCPDLQVNFGDSCNDGIPGNGIDQYNEFCECVGLPFAGCTNGVPFGSASVICGTTQSVFGVWANEYSTINGLLTDGEYTFAALGVGADYFLTITNLAGTEVLATGQGTVEYTSDVAQNVRFYAHVNDQCSATGGFATSHTRTIAAFCPSIELPENDLACGAIDITCGQTISGTTIGATADDVPFCGTSNGTGGGLWYLFTPENAGIAEASLCGSDFDTKIRVFSGTCETLVCVGGNDDNFAVCGAGNNSYLEFAYTAGENYYILIHGFSAAQGNFDFELTCVEGCPDGSNPGDACDDGDPTTGLDTVQEDCTCAGIPLQENDDACGALAVNCGDIISGSTVGALADDVPFCGTSNGTGGGLWYLFTPVNSGVGTASLCGSNFDTKIRVFSGDCQTLVCVGGNDDNFTACGSGNNSHLEFTYTAGESYYILIHGFSAAQGNFNFELTCEDENGPNPGCEDATFIAAQPEFVMSEIPVSIAGLQSSGATQCQNAGNPQVDQWFSFTSVTTNMYVRAWGLGDFDAAIEVYNACGGTQLLCQNNEGAGLREIGIITNTTVGETYYFRVYHGGTTAPATQVYTVAVAHIPFTQLRAADCGVYDYTPASIIRSDWPINQFLLANWYFEFTELEAPFNVYEVLSPNGSNPQFSLSWFTQAQYGRTYSVRTRARMYQGPHWGDYGAACEIGFSVAGGVTQLIESQALGFYNMCDILEADNVPGAVGYRWRFIDGFETLIHDTPNRFLALQNVEGLNLGQPYAVKVRSYFNGQFSGPGLTRLISMNNFVVETGLDQNINTCGSTYALSTVLSAVNICAADFYTFRFTNISNPDQAPLFYTRDDGNRTILLGWVTGLVPGDTYAVQVLGGSGGLVGTYGYSCNITIAGGDGPGFSPDVATPMSDDAAALIQLYPNPTMGDEVMLVLSNLDNEQQSIIVEVYDMFGKKVHNQNIANNGSEMNAALRFQKSLASGVYMVNVIINDQLAGAQKLVVQ